MKLLELDYIANKKKRPIPFQPQIQSPSLIQPLSRNVKQEYEQTSRQNASRRIPLKDSFNPKMIGQSPNPSNPSQMIRTYTVPDGSGRVLMLNRPCRTCGGNHFDFEPVHVQTSTSWSDSSSNMESYPVFTQNCQLSIDYPAYTPQTFDPQVQTNDAAYPMLHSSYQPAVSDEDYAYQMMRADSYECFSPESTDSSRFEEENSSSSTNLSPPSSKK